MIGVLAATVHVPGRSAADMAGSPPEPAEDADDAHRVLGRKGLLGKEPATRLALCAVHRLFGLPPGKPREPLELPVPASDIAVVVASHLGNVQTVCNLVSDVRTHGVRGVSAMEAPNASSNVIASTIAIWYGLTGPNLAVCSGATSGLDAVRLAAVLVKGRRARRALVVGVEPGDAVATALAGGELRTGAAAILLGEPREDTPVLGEVREVAEPGPGTPECYYGASGVIGVASACATPRRSHVIHCGDPADGFVGVELTRD